jgi:hypothetical protein
LLLMANPYWSLRRFMWHAYAASKRQGAAGRLVAAQGWSRLPLILGWAHVSAARRLPSALRNRWKIQKGRRLKTREIHELLRRFQIDLRQLTLRD